MRFGSLLRELREARSMRLGEVAEAAGIKVAYLSQLELGRRRPPEEEVVNRLIQPLKASGEDRRKLKMLAELERKSFKLDLAGRSREEQDMMVALGRAWDDRTLTQDQARKIAGILHGEED